MLWFDGPVKNAVEKVKSNGFTLIVFVQDVNVPIPSIFLIGNDGIPIKVISSKRISDVSHAINNAFEDQKLKNLICKKLERENAQKSHKIKTNISNMPSWEFPDLSTLGDIKAYLSEKIKLSTNFKLLRAFPRTTFTTEDETKTLVDLSLTPNATLIVIPGILIIPENR
ncbi:hypothetical protein Phum_PHUM090380 [Pediculus humanus corporis]|uniref:UBX domain-containing protein 4 n=1 Tax=Pediculus humanus subsp. corporis TaxID=121224 RepID=E0VCM2_PEDHC|nr:uncharacterized protein Phum_PHUM090380 [Pediculus humanus corporis]EEB11128.1 hypothetical protein Phum_PHUM090380 [Pediculus humanus corporis]